MSEREILLSERYAVNPSVEQCFVCGQDVGVVLFGRLRGDREAPRRVCFGPNSPNSRPCRECEKYMKMGVILISVDESKSEDMMNPFRTGGWVVVGENFIKRTFKSKELVDAILKYRMAFVSDSAWGVLGLPREKDEDHREGP